VSRRGTDGRFGFSLVTLYRRSISAAAVDEGARRLRHGYTGAGDADHDVASGAEERDALVEERCVGGTRLLSGVRREGEELLACDDE
jgi:hypothetical protein